jgi:hypothetical protein
MLALHLLRIAIALILFGRGRSRGAITVVARAVGIGVFVGAARNVSPFGWAYRLVAIAVSLTHGRLLGVEPFPRAGPMPRVWPHALLHTWQSGLECDIFPADLAMIPG